LSHHIRNSLVAVKTFLDLAPVKMNEEKTDLQGLRNPDFWKDYHRNVQSQIERINALLKDLWTASSNPSAPFTDQVSLHQIIGDAVTLLHEPFAARRIVVDSQVADTLPLLRVDKLKFSRLFELLLKEELAMLPAGSHIALTAELRDGPPPEIVVHINDNGPGLSEDALRAVFDPFVVHDHKPSEYGIHLMACFFIVHHHGGKIAARSQPGKGTTFTLHLPLQPEPVAVSSSDTDFLKKALLNDNLWEKLLASA
jgi:signal transduction histidine kinase